MADAAMAICVPEETPCGAWKEIWYGALDCVMSGALLMMWPAMVVPSSLRTT